jgi:hypothetical protein
MAPKISRKLSKRIFYLQKKEGSATNKKDLLSVFSLFLNTSESRKIAGIIVRMSDYWILSLKLHLKFNRLRSIILPLEETN